MPLTEGNDVFNRQATEYLREDLNPNVLYRLTFTLIDSLQQQDWQTEADSLDQFRTSLPIVAAFYNNGVNNSVDEIDSAHLEYDPDAREWSLVCNNCHTNVARAPLTAAGHDQLLHTWSAHDIGEHGGEGKLGWDDMFLIRTDDEDGGEPALLTAQIADLVVSFPRGWSLDCSDGTDPGRFVIEFTRPLPESAPVVDGLFAGETS